MAKTISKTVQRNSRTQSPIPFRVTEEERQKLARAAARVGLTVSAYIRTRVLDEGSTMRATRKPSVEAETLAKLLGQIGKVAGSIQQLAGKATIQDKTESKDVLATLAETRKAATAIITAMGRKPHDH